MPEGYRHFFMEKSGRAIDFTSKKRGRNKFNNPSRNRHEHGMKIKRQLEECWRENQELEEQRRTVSLPTKEGMYLEFESAPAYELVTKSLEHRGSGIKLLFVRTEKIEDKEIRKATVFIPAGKEFIFLNKVQAYIEEDSKNHKPKNQPLIESLEDIKLAVLESFWQGKKEWIPDQREEWCEIWLSDDSKEVETSFRQLAQEELHIEIQEESLEFPERRVLLGKVNRHQLQELIMASPHIAEFRRAPETVFFDELDNKEQTEWSEDLQERMEVDRDSKVCICILDTGVNNGHILLKPVLMDQDCYAYDESWGTHDHNSHGTNMSGLAVFGDLEAALLSREVVRIRHNLESAKILPPQGENDPKLYGAIVSQSVSNMTVNNPERQRIICMAITSPKYSADDGSPSSWSSAIDELSSGYLDEQQKLIIISAGNINESEEWDDYPESNKTRTVQNPGQSWNAVTVGAFTAITEIDERKYSGKALAPAGGLSPYSPTSCLWEKKWPIKPDIVFEGGNVLRDSYGCVQCTEFSLLTLHHRPSERQFSTTWATSAATA